jgi:hypothetical protein
MSQKEELIKAAAVARASGALIRDLVTENQGLQAKVAHYEKERLCTKLAEECVRKQCSTDPVEKIAGELMQKTASELQIFEQALQFSAGTQIKVGELADPSMRRSSSNGLVGLLMGQGHS